MSMITEQGNILIAAFEGRKFYGKHTIDKYGGDTGNALPEMKYHEDWNWLMAVIEKIESSADQQTGHIEIQITENHCTIYQYSYKPKFKTFDANSKINAVWQAVVQFIQWYNTQTTDNGQ